MRRVAVVLLTLTLLLSACGLAKGGEEPTFEELSQADKQAFLSEYLSARYGIDDAAFDTVVKQDGDEEFFATARLPSGDVIYCWVTDGGYVTDTAFVLDMRDAISALFESCVTRGLTKCTIAYALTFDGKPSRQWTSAEAREMFRTESITVDLRVYLDKENEPEVNRRINSLFGNALDFTDGTVYFYYNVDPDEADPEAYDSMFMFTKKEK